MSPILYANIALSMHKYSWKKYNNMFLSVIFSSVGPRVGVVFNINFEVNRTLSMKYF